MVKRIYSRCNIVHTTSLKGLFARVHGKGQKNKRNKTKKKKTCIGGNTPHIMCKPVIVCTSMHKMDEACIHGRAAGLGWAAALARRPRCGVEYESQANHDPRFTTSTNASKKEKKKKTQNYSWPGVSKIAHCVCRPLVHPISSATLHTQTPLSYYTKTVLSASSLYFLFSVIRCTGLDK